MRKILVLGAAIVLLGFGAPKAHAMMVANGGDLSTWDGASPLPVSLYNLVGAKLTNLKSTIAELNGNVVQQGTNLLYTSTKGIYQAKVGQAESKAKVIYKQDDLSSLVNQGTAWVITDATAGAKNPIFIFNLGTKKISAFSLKATDVETASLAKGGTMVAFIGKDSKGASKIFISNGSLTNLKASAFPTGYTICTKPTLSPGGTTIAMLCQKDELSGTEVIVSKVTRGGLGTIMVAKKSGVTPYLLTWLNEQSLVSMSSDVLFSDDLTTYSYLVKMATVTVKSGKATMATPVTLTTTSVVPAGQMIIAPLQLTTLSATKVMFVFEYLGTDSNGATRFSSVIGTYRTDTKKTTYSIAKKAFYFLAEVGI